MSILKRLDSEVVDLVKEEDVLQVKIERADAYMEDVYDMMPSLSSCFRRRTL